MGMKERRTKWHLIAWWTEVGRASAMVRSLHELEWREEKGEERGSLDEGGMWVAVSPKEENRRGRRFGTGMRARIKSRLDAGKTRSAQCTSTVDAA